MDVSEVKMKILEHTGWTVKQLEKTLKEMQKKSAYYKNEEFAYWVIAKNKKIEIKETEFAPREKPKDDLVLYDIEEATESADDGEYFDIMLKVLEGLRPAPSEKIAFINVGDKTAITSLKVFPDDWELFNDLVVGKTYLFQRVRAQHNSEFGFGIFGNAFTEYEDIDKDLSLPITHIAALEESYDPVVIKGVLTGFKESDIEFGFCNQCNRYVTHGNEMDKDFCENCQEAVEVTFSNTISGRLNDETGSIKLSFPPFREVIFDDGDVWTILGNYSEKKNTLYVSQVINQGVKMNISLDKFIKPKQKRKKKTVVDASTVVTIDLDGIIADYQEHRKVYGDAVNLTVADVFKLFDSYNVKTVKQAQDVMFKLVELDE